MKILSNFLAILSFITLVGIWVTLSEQTHLMWKEQKGIEALLPPTRYQGVIHYASGEDTTYFMTSQYYDYQIAEKVCQYYTAQDNDSLGGYTRVWYEILTDCAECQQ